MTQQNMAMGSRSHGALASLGRALAGDADLGARVGTALAGPLTAGLAAGAALAALLDRPGGVPGWALWALTGACVGALVGLVLAAWAVADRRHLRRARRARLRATAALAAGALAVLLIGLAGSPTGAATGIALSAALAVAVGLSGGLGMRAAGRLAARAMAERRRAWRAQLRASRLTRRMLGMADYRQLRREGALPVKSTLYPNRTYLVPLRTTPSGARILVLENGRAIGGLCSRPREVLPDPEEALTHILAIRANERAWLERANFFPQDRSLTPQARGLLPGRPGNYDR